MERFYYYAPVVLIVVFEASYQMAAKGMPSANNVFANLVWVYLTSAALSVALFFATNKSGGLISEMCGTNWGAALTYILYGFKTDLSSHSVIYPAAKGQPCGRPC